MMKLSRKEFSKNVIDSSHLAHIENNRNEIRAITFIELLNENNISIIDFLETFDSFHAQGHAMQIKASEAFFNHDIDALKQMIATSPYPDSVAIQVLKFMVDKLMGQSEAFPRKNQLIIKKFLLTLEDWDENCLWIIANSLEIHDLEEADRIINWLLCNERDFAHYTDYRIKLLAQIVIRYLIVALKAGYDQARIEPIYQYLAALPNRSIIFYEKMQGVYIKAAQRGQEDKMFTLSQYLDLE